MAQIGNIPAIREIKRRLQDMQYKGLVKEWEIPFEQTLTRLDAALLFLTPGQPSDLDKVLAGLRQYGRTEHRPNVEKKLSQLEWRVEFHDEH